MRIRFKTLMAGPEGVFQPGSVIDLKVDEADALVSAGYASRWSACLKRRLSNPAIGLSGQFPARER